MLILQEMQSWNAFGVWEWSLLLITKLSYSNQRTFTSFFFARTCQQSGVIRCFILLYIWATCVLIFLGDNAFIWFRPILLNAWFLLFLPIWGTTLIRAATVTRMALCTKLGSTVWLVTFFFGHGSLPWLQSLFLRVNCYLRHHFSHAFARSWFYVALSWHVTFVSPQSLHSFLLDALLNFIF